MATTITIPFWPACMDNTKWSQDNLIAIAGSECIAVLTPRLKGKGNAEATWSYSVIKVNAFVEGELPLAEPLGYNVWSVGEELSQRFVECMEWSPPGLGSFDSCCLAILHSDHSLSLWDCRGGPDNKDNWHMTLVISTAIMDHYDSLESIAIDDREEILQLRQRIHSFAWEPTSHDFEAENMHTDSTRRMAVATAVGDILVLQITSPYSVLANNKGKDWTAMVQHKIPCSLELPQLDRSADHSFAHDSKVIEHLTWINQPQQDTRDITVAFLSQSSCYLCQSQIPSAADTSSVSATLRRLTPEGVRAEGPLRCSPDGRLLFYFVGNALIEYDLLSAEARSHHIDRGWSEVSGLALGPGHLQNKEVFPATHLSYERLRSNVSLATDGSTPELVDTHTFLNHFINEYIARNEVSGGVHTRTWGIDVAPTGTQLACCTNVVPAASVTHVIQAAQECLVSICDIPGSDSSNWQGSVEGVLYGLQARESAPQDAEVSLAIHSFITACRRQECTLAALTHLGTSAAAALRIHNEVLLSQERLQDMGHRLEAIASGRVYTTSPPAAVYQILCRTALEVFRDVPGARLSACCLFLYQRLLTKLSPETQAGPLDTLPSKEKCTVCDEALVFEAIRWARCKTGHRFTRCAVTLLAIPRPSAAKHCIICELQYLNEQTVSELHFCQDSDDAMNITDEAGSTSVVEPDHSPVRLLLSIFKRCILCNGRLVA